MGGGGSLRKSIESPALERRQQLYRRGEVSQSVGSVERKGGIDRSAARRPWGWEEEERRPLRKPPEGLPRHPSAYNHVYHHSRTSPAAPLSPPGPIGPLRAYVRALLPPPADPNPPQGADATSAPLAWRHACRHSVMRSHPSFNPPALDSQSTRCVRVSSWPGPVSSAQAPWPAVSSPWPPCWQPRSPRVSNDTR